jgi:hypothetical protein
VLTTITPKKQPGYSVLTKYSLFSSEMKHCLNLGEDEDRRGDKDRHHHDPDPPFGDPTAGDGFSRSTANGIKYRVMPEAASRQIWMLPTQPNPTERPGTYGTPHPHCPRSPSTKQPPSSLPLPLLTPWGSRVAALFSPRVRGRGSRGVLDSARGNRHGRARCGRRSSVGGALVTYPFSPDGFRCCSFCFYNAKAVIFFLRNSGDFWVSFRWIACGLHPLSPRAVERSSLKLQF